MALRGDAVKRKPILNPEKNGHAFAKDLVEQIVKMNHGTYLDESLENSACTDFNIPVLLVILKNTWKQQVWNRHLPPQEK